MKDFPKGNYYLSEQLNRAALSISTNIAEGKTLDNYRDLKFFLEKLFHRKIDLVIKDALKAQIRNKVLSEAK